MSKQTKDIDPPVDSKKYPVTILSMEPECAEAVLRGTRSWDFRYRSQQMIIGDKTLIFAGSPVNKIVGKISLWAEVVGSHAAVWKIINTGPGCVGITKDEFNNLFNGISPVYAQHIEDVQTVDGPTLEVINKKSLEVAGVGWRPPEDWGMAFWAPASFWGIK